MSRHPFIRAAHDVGLATYFGGSLMGATALNAAASQLDDPAQRAHASTRGWTRWTPVGIAGLAAHTAASGAMLLTDLPRVRGQRGVGRSTTAKTAVTAATLATAAYSGVLNRKMAAAGPVPVQGATEPSAVTPPEVASTQRRLKVVQWLDPLLAGALVAMTSWHSEQQRPAQVARGTVQRLSGSLARPVPLAVAGIAAAGLLAARRRSSSAADHAIPVYPVTAGTQAESAGAPTSPVGTSAAATAHVRPTATTTSYAPPAGGNR